MPGSAYAPPRAQGHRGGEARRRHDPSAAPWCVRRDAPGMRGVAGCGASRAGGRGTLWHAQDTRSLGPAGSRRSRWTPQGDTRARWAHQVVRGATVIPLAETVLPWVAMLHVVQRAPTMQELLKVCSWHYMHETLMKSRSQHGHACMAMPMRKDTHTPIALCGAVLAGGGSARGYGLTQE